MANPVKGEVPLEAGGTRYTFVLGTYALAALERRMRTPWTRIFKRAADGEWGIDDVLAIVHCGLLRHHRQMTEEQAADLIDQVGLDGINKLIGEAVRLMQPEASQGEAQIPENPTKPGNGHLTTSYPTGS
jgi:Phage tail tube protein, GTA-gp10